MLRRGSDVVMILLLWSGDEFTQAWTCSCLTPGKTYLIDITARVDAKANMETSPYRTAIPSASANVVSAPIKISTDAP